MMQAINLSLGSYPAHPPGIGLQKAIDGAVYDPVLGPLAFEDVQICPQNCIQQVNEAYLDELMASFPSTRFRMHANVKVLDKHIPIADLSGFSRFRGYFNQLAAMSKHIGAQAYTLHAGRREMCPDFNRLLASRKRLEDLFEVPVGIEGLYPTNRKSDHYWVSSWAEYQQLFEANVPYALDLSHLNIVATHEGKFELNLASEMLQSPNCIEVHLSGNDGTADSHKQLDGDIWWLPFLKDIHADSVVFYEGILTRKN